ncbi:MAG: hypothetical protein LBR78_01595, partial [Holosporales bacterium]|nr:hypothetical protein [Holosporales bacterium]
VDEVEIGDVVERGVADHVMEMQGVVARQAHQLRCYQEVIESYERLSRRLLRKLEGLESTAQTTPAVPVAPLLDGRLIAKMRADIIFDENGTPPQFRRELQPLMIGPGSNLRPDRVVAEDVPQWEWETIGEPARSDVLSHVLIMVQDAHNPSHPSGITVVTTDPLYGESQWNDGESEMWAHQADNPTLGEPVPYVPSENEWTIHLYAYAKDQGNYLGYRPAVGARDIRPEDIFGMYTGNTVLGNSLWPKLHHNTTGPRCHAIKGVTYNNPILDLGLPVGNK